MENASTKLNTKKRSKGVTVVGWTEVIISSVIIFFALVSFAQSIYRGGTRHSLFLGLGAAFLLAIFLLLSGILILKLKSLGRKMSMVIMTVAMALFLLPKDSWTDFIGFLSIFAIAWLSLIYFFTRPRVKEQFSKKT